MTSQPLKPTLGPAVFSVLGPSRRTEASQPWTKQSWKCILNKPGATEGLKWGVCFTFLSGTGLTRIIVPCLVSLGTNLNETSPDLCGLSPSLGRLSKAPRKPRDC
ncbi:hypothetical protein DVH24_033233 [Malus domestica]|uniref:Uncharacterized protein n=1 Tax=Malus domestica TaxID=3750 RepID=A0A498JC20_MALDO|nr:hypothetical protein DVH24_033233 [Malus domestica]